MKVKTLLLAVLAMCVGSSIQAQTTSSGKKILVAYFSWSENGNTRNLANQIKLKTGADIFEITPVSAYSTNYEDCLAQARKEIDSNFKPEIKGPVDNFESYDIIIVGSPIWCGTIAPPVATFLSNHDFSGKTVLPFVTFGGGGPGKSMEDIKNLCSNAVLLDVFSITGNKVNEIESDIHKWLKDSNIAE